VVESRVVEALGPTDRFKVVEALGPTDEFKLKLNSIDVCLSIEVDIFVVISESNDVQ
jgi:hypothetical protein